MKFSCSQSTLSKSLNIVSKAVSSRTTIPILKGILLTVKDNKLTLTASDLDLSIETKMDIFSGEEGTAVVSAKLFTDIIRKLPDASVEVSSEDTKMNIRCLGSDFDIVALASEEFPSIGMVTQLNKMDINKNTLIDIIKKTTFSASIDEKKGILVGVNMKFSEGRLEAAALDGFRMAIASDEIETEEEKSVVIPARILNEINKLLSENSEEETVSLVFDNKRAEIITGETRIVSRLLEGDYIKYNDIVPKTYNTRLTVSRKEMINSIERASLLAKEGKHNLVKFEIGSSSVEITSRSEEGNVKENISAEVEGNGLTIGFNSKYIMDVLRAVEDEDVLFELGTNTSPCLIKPVEGDNYTYLVLPVRITA